MRKKYLFLSVIAAAALVAGCGNADDGYGRYVTLGDYKNLSATLSVEEVTDEELEEYEKEQLADYVSYDEVQTPIEEGQMVSTSLLAKDGDEIVYDFSEEEYDIFVGEEEFGAELDDALVGHVTGDTLDLEISYDEDFPDTSLSGRQINYHIEVLAVSDVVYPELTDEFVKENFGETSAETWRETLREELRSLHQEEAKEEMRGDLLQQAVDGAQIKGYPRSLYKQKRAELEAEYQDYAEMFGCSLEEVYEMLDIDEKTCRQESLDATYQAMVLEMIRQQEKLSLTEEQMQEQMQEYAVENEYESVEELLTEYDEESLKQYFLDELTLDFLEDHADIH